MLNSKISALSIVIFLSSLLLMRWLTTEEKWWSGLVVFVIIAIYFGPKSVNRFKQQFLDAVEERKRVKAIVASLNMLFLSQGYFLLLALVYYVVMALGVSLSKMSLHLEGWGVGGVFFLTKVIGLLLSNILFVPIVCLFSMFIYSWCSSAANKRTN